MSKSWDALQKLKAVVEDYDERDMHSESDTVLGRIPRAADTERPPTLTFGDLRAIASILSARGPTGPAALKDWVEGRAVLVPRKLTDDMMDAACTIDAYDIIVHENKKSHEALMAKYPDVKPIETHGAAPCQTLPLLWDAMLGASPYEAASPAAPDGETK
jgi:hypothetical protein